MLPNERLTPQKEAIFELKKKFKNELLSTSWRQIQIGLKIELKWIIPFFRIPTINISN